MATTLKLLLNMNVIKWLQSYEKLNNMSPRQRQRALSARPFSASPL